MSRIRASASARDPRGTSSYVRLLRVGRSPLLAVALIAIAALALSACGSSTGTGSTGSGSGGAIAGSLNTPELYGTLPAQGTPTQGGTITYGQLTGETPNYIFPIIPSGDARTYKYQWQSMMYLPLYNNLAYGRSRRRSTTVSAWRPKSPCSATATRPSPIQLKQGYKWSNGEPVNAQDLLFDVALIKAAVAESAANWASFTPGYFPDSLASISATGPYTVVMHLKQAFNPGFFLNNQLAFNVYPLPSTAWNVASAGGPHLNWNIPANAKKIYDYLRKAGGAGRARSPATRCGRSPTGRSCCRASARSPAPGRSRSNPDLRRHARSRTSTRSRASPTPASPRC